jgi:hypothetical protein
MRHTVTMLRIVLPNSLGRLTSGVEVLEPFVIDLNEAMMPIECTPCPEADCRIVRRAEAKNVIR